MNTAVNLADEVRQSLEALPHLDARSVRTVRRQFGKRLANDSPQVVLRFVKSLLDRGGWAERVVAWEILAAHPSAFALLNDRLVEQMAQGLSDWPSVDLYGVTVVGQAWRSGLITDGKIVKWTRSPDRWRRRLALVATVPLNLRSRGGSGDTARTLAVCRMLIDDRDDMVVKALSWALRELSKRNPDSVAGFINQENGRLASRVRREVRTKLETGRKVSRSRSYKTR